MIRIVLRKMLRNKWMVLCLLIGSVLAVAMVSSVPTYTDAVLQRMLTKDLENFQVEKGVFPGHYSVSVNYIYFNEPSKRVEWFNIFNNEIENNMSKEYGLPATTQSTKITIDPLRLMPVGREIFEKDGKNIKIDGLSNLQEHIQLVDGRMSSGKMEDGVYEGMATLEAMRKLDLLVGETYSIKETSFTTGLKEQTREIFKVKLVGVFTYKDQEDPYWYDGMSVFNESLVVDSALFTNDFLKMDPPLLSESKWFYALDYHKIKISQIPSILSAFEGQDKWKNRNGRILDLKLPLVTVLEQYADREKNLKMTLWVIQIPILMMLAFYIFMVSQLIVETEKNEIAVLKSRGASKLQIFYSYLLESGILSIVALIIGPFLGLFLCNIVGASSGFLEFVQRAKLPTVLGIPAYIYSIWAVFLFVLTMMIPVFLSSRTNIVQHKQKKSRLNSLPFWHKYFLDVILLGVALYGRYSYKTLQTLLGKTGVKGSELGMDPVMFISSTLFIIGAGLLFLRLFPFAIRFIFWLGRKIWSPVFYASFIQVGRSGGQEQFIMLFLILTLSIGIFSANAARTINKNIEDRVKYGNGADITIKAVWDKILPPSSDMGGPDEGGEAAAPTTSSSTPVQYEEPPYTPFTELNGIEAVTKVFVKRGNIDAKPGDGKWIGSTSIMGIIPEEFGKVAWFRDDLLPSHWYNYLNLLAKDPQAMLVSSSFRDTYKLKVGDRIMVKWDSAQSSLDGVVYGFIDNWPSFNLRAAKTAKTPPTLVVANLSYIQQNMLLEPYEVWAKRKPGATSEEIYNDIKAKNLQIAEIKNSTIDIVQQKNNPTHQGTNGSLTLGFIVTMAISTIGFLIYWILSIRARILQFGILRAMGLSMGKVIGMIICEQIMISGTAVFMGITIGGITCDLFMNMLEAASSADQQVPKMMVMSSPEDYIRIYIFVATMLTMAIVFLGAFISKLKINQALKLGED